MAVTAVEKLQPSRLSAQLELLADDIDLDQLQLRTKGRKPFPIREAVTAADLARTIEGASTLTITIRDRDRKLLASGLLDHQTVEQGVDMLIDGLWWRLAAHSKQGDDLLLTFESREVMLLRRYPLKTAAPKTWWRSWPTDTTTRTMFARSLINDVQELKIRFVATESRNPKQAG